MFERTTIHFSFHLNPFVVASLKTNKNKRRKPKAWQGFLSLDIIYEQIWIGASPVKVEGSRKIITYKQLKMHGKSLYTKNM